MLWVSLAILAAIMWAIVNALDKYIVDKLVKNPLVSIIVLAFLSLTAAIVVYLIHGVSSLSPYHLLLILITAPFNLLMNVFYFKAAKLEEISRLVPIFYLSSFFIGILAAIFLSEIFAPSRYLGVFLLMTGAIIISFKRGFKLRLRSAFWFMILSTLCLTINSVLVKYLLNFADYWTIFVYLRVTFFIAATPIIYKNLPDLVSSVRMNGKKVIGTIALSESINLSAAFLSIIATASGYVTLVNALFSTQPLFLFLIMIGLSVFYPRILKEEIDKRSLALKFVAIIMMFVGALLVT